ncbi:DUF4153 domain-containing protein [Ramlibacter tataouinensis]|uniref:DUF4153 domain-containing protein n=1 Tax=Ramlibacter tataouinensis TaxID=94132 RepID=UPI0022F3F6B4|nr:DUF4153 domain-containing protein [Ramlibacter tataouinensis]WBY02526.1 DUF4153 domain-containing protein [Ramlibacter tataouinensis]
MQHQGSRESPEGRGSAVQDPGNSLLAALVLGSVQGVALRALHVSAAGWGANEPALHQALLQFVVAAPLAWWLGEGGFLSGLRRGAAALAVGLLVGLLGAHAGATVAPGAGNVPRFAEWLATTVLVHVAVALVAGFDPATRRFVYARLFEVAWRNALVVPLAAALTGIFWTLLWAAAWLLRAIGIHWLWDLLAEPATLTIVTAAIFAVSLAAALRRASALVALRRAWLSLNTWFLPLALALALVAVLGVAVMGMAQLFATRSAAAILFWFASLAVLFLNAAWQDGRTAPGLPPPLPRLVPWAWLALPVLAVLGCWALWLRVQQHGWSPDRVWAALVAAMTLVYAFGYAASLRSRGRWMTTVGPTNVAAAIVLAAGLVVLLSPLADVRKLSVRSQLARLESGVIAAADFDFRFLAREGGRYGHEALQKLAAGGVAEVRQGASAALARAAGNQPPRTDAAAAQAAWREQVRVLPQGARVDPALLQWLAREQADWVEKSCAATPAQCVLWWIPARGDAPAQAVLLWARDARGARAVAYGFEPAGWRRQGDLVGKDLPLSEWTQAIEGGGARWVEPRWPDLQIGQARLRVR